jgi:hypothetical protein
MFELLSNRDLVEQRELLVHALPESLRVVQWVDFKVQQLRLKLLFVGKFLLHFLQ